MNTQIAVKSEMNVRMKWTSPAHIGLRANIYADVGLETGSVKIDIEKHFLYANYLDLENNEHGTTRLDRR